MMDFIHYYRKGFSVGQIVYIMTGCKPLEIIADFLLRVVVVGLLVCLIYGTVEFTESRVEEIKNEQQSYVRDLQNLVAVCTERGTHSLKIGDEWWLVSVSPTGIK